MWYFTWVLGLGLAVAFGILNGMWHEFHLPDEIETDAGSGN
ncbi:MAG: cytochrome bd-I oxidase subunit CydX [Sphingomonas sp.]|nr:cytochrome bd-I oxidase subunit CydX [Sphingomonas sp.]MBN8814415.1 cytochrome bd-I oxidase subunit CydX [Sphingomonas sp.]